MRKEDAIVREKVNSLNAHFNIFESSLFLIVYLVQLFFLTSRLLHKQIQRVKWIFKNLNSIRIPIRLRNS